MAPSHSPTFSRAATSAIGVSGCSWHGGSCGHHRNEFRKSRLPLPVEVRGRVVVFGSSPIPRFSIPLIAGRDETIVTVDPQTDGAFTVFLPAGEHRTGTPLGLPSGYAIQSLGYGSVDLLREPLKVSSDNSSELLIRQKIEEFQSAIVPKLGDKGPRFSQGPSFDPGNPSHGTEFLPAPQHSAS